MIHVAGCADTATDHPVCRDKTGKPRIILPDGETVRSYNRASSFGDALDDKGGLIAWSQANAVRGVLTYPTLGEQFLAADDGWVTADAITATKAVIAQAAVAGGAEVKANRGTNLHTWTEALDRGEQPVGVPPEFEADLMAYEYATEGMRHLLIERFCVLDDHRVAGTPDRITEYGGDIYVFDVKTGSVAYPGKMAVQLAVYSRSMLYTQNPDGTAVREHLPLVNRERAIILHLPAGQGRATAYWLDIAAGWAQVTGEAPGGIPGVKAWRANQKNLLTPIG